MSLHIGNLPQRIRKDELERVFQRFGRCTVQLKGGYGFAVYDIRAQAETALRQLKGKRVCGEFLSLSWSNKQPHMLQQLARDAKSFKMHNRRDFAGGDILFGSNQRPNARNVSRFYQRQLNPHGRRPESAEIHDERRRLIRDYEGQEFHSPVKELQRLGDSTDPNFLDADGGRDDEVDNLSNDAAHVFDRYQPDRDYESGEADERYQITDFGSYAGKEIPGEETRENRNGGQAMYHYANRRDNKSCFVCGFLGHKMRDCPQKHALSSKAENIRSRGRYEEFKEYTSRGRLTLRNGMLVEQCGSYNNGSGSGNPDNVKRRMQARDHSRDNSKEFRNKRKGEDENGTLDGRDARRVKRSASTSSQSRPASKRSNAHSTSSLSVSTSSSPSRSRTISSSSYSSRSEPLSDQLKSGAGILKSTHRSRSPTPMSPSTLLGHPLATPPLKKHETMSLKSKLTMQEDHHQEIVIPEQYSGSGNVESDLKDGSTADVVEMEDNIEIDGLEKNVVNNQSEPSIRSDGNNQGSASLEPFSENDKPLQSVRDFMSESKEKSDSKGLTHPHSGKCSISVEELCHVMKHYNLEYTGGGELSVEDYFGSSRLWPWAMIYYRRLKKGAVSSENYARRLAQNSDFGITDKYVRSSSGWGESNQE